MVLSWDTAADWDAGSDTRIEHESERGADSIRLGRDNTEQTPLAFYRYHDGSGTTLTDVSGNAHNGSITGATWTTAPSRFAGALAADGVDDYVRLGSLYSGGVSEFETWFYPRDGTTQSQILGCQYQCWDITYNRSGNQQINIGVYGDNTTLSGTLAANEWHHVYARYDTGTAIGGAVNGNSISTVSTSDTPSDTSHPTELSGKPTRDAGYADCLQAETRLFESNSAVITSPSDSLYVTDGSLTTGWKS